jgi:aspartyl-tRNA synthetase
MNFKKRTHTCGELRKKDVGESVVLNGWVDSRRDLGGVIFIGLRDRYGIVQVVFDSEQNESAHKIGKELRSEFVVSVEGKVIERPDDQIVSAMDTGEIDVVVESVTILNEAETPPFPIKDNVDAFDDLKLKYRYLDLRRAPLQKNLRCTGLSRSEQAAQGKVLCAAAIATNL